MSSYKCCKINSEDFEKLTSLSNFLKLIGEKNRLKLLCLLNSGEHCICEVPKNFAMSQSLISHHLADLKKAKLVNKRKEGRRAYYSLTKKGQKVTSHILALVN